MMEANVNLRETAILSYPYNTKIIKFYVEIMLSHIRVMLKLACKYLWDVQFHMYLLGT